MCAHKCAEIAIKLATLNELLKHWLHPTIADRLESQHRLLLLEFDRLNQEWNAHKCDGIQRKLGAKSMLALYLDASLASSERGTEK